MIYFLWVTPQTPHHCLLIQTHNTAETVSLFMPLDVTADLQSHCSVLSPVILSSFLSWTRASKRCMDKFPLVCEPLVPPLLVAPHLMFCHLHLWVCSGKDPCTHTHTQTCNTSTPMLGTGTQMQTGNMWQYTKNHWFIHNIEISIFLIGKSTFWSSNVNYTKVQIPWRSISTYILI